MLTAISFRMLRMRRFVRRSLRERDQLQLSILLVSVIYCAYMVTLISLFGINYLVRGRKGRGAPAYHTHPPPPRDAQVNVNGLQKPYPPNTLAAIVGALIGARGILTLIIFVTLGESSLRVYCRNLRSRARDVGIARAFRQDERALAAAYRSRRKSSVAVASTAAVALGEGGPVSVCTERIDSHRSEEDDEDEEVARNSDDDGLEPNVNRWLREEIEVFTQTYAARGARPSCAFPLLPSPMAFHARNDPGDGPETLPPAALATLLSSPATAPKAVSSGCLTRAPRETLSP